MSGHEVDALTRLRFRQRLGVRLAALLGLGALMSAMLATAAMLAIAWYHAERDSREEAQLVARSVAFALQAPVSFADTQGIHDAVAVLEARPQIQGAWVHDHTGKLLHSRGRATLREGQGELGSLASGWLQLSLPIVAGSAGETVGRVTLHLSLEDVQSKLRVEAMAAAAASLVAALLALNVSQIFARRISVPVVRLAETAAKITREQNYELRLPPAGRDEVGVAVKAFNHMLAEIEQRGTTLVTMNRQLEQQAKVAQAAQAQAESASLAKTRFLANMSHELRSPLNGVIGAAQLLHLEGADAARRAELVEIIRTSGGNLLGLIEHVLDLARIEAGGLVLERQDFNLLECIETAVVSAAALATAKGLHLSCSIDPAVALWRHGDDLRLRQLVLNLLGNAIKFTDLGDVSVEVRAVEGHADRLQIQVRDTGIGIAPDALARVFEPFQQADASTTRRFGGSGLGLSICRDLAQLMGGDVVAQSVSGVGSCFTLDLPLPLAARAAAGTAPLGLRVAWCEPHEPSALALAALLQRLGCESQRCHDVAAAESFLKHADARGRPPWFIVATDAELGRTLLAAVLMKLDPCHVLPIDGAADGEQALAREALGLPRAMPRPVLSSTLLSRLGSVAGLAGIEGEPGATAPSFPAPLDGARAVGHVLLVEDDAINQTIVRAMLQHAGFACSVVSNGSMALQHLWHSRYDLVLMDWQMPGMDGLEATRRLRAGDAGELNRKVPVVALTANAFAEDRSTCLAAGMNDFVTKPVLAAHLLAVVGRWALRGPTPDAVLLPADQAVQEGGAVVYDPGILAQLPMVADGSDPQYVQRVLALFERSVRETLVNIEQGLAQRDMAAVQRGVHSLKSSAGQVGALALAAEAGHIDAALRRGEVDADSLPPLLKRLRLARQRFADAVAARPAG